MFPPEADAFEDVLSLPRARGGVSQSVRLSATILQSSSRTRGCFLKVAIYLRIEDVFPAHAGVFLGGTTLSRLGLCLPRARGGVSSSVSSVITSALSSPRTRGCF